MDMPRRIVGIDGRVLGNLFAGAVGISVAALLVLITLQFKEHLSATFLIFALFVFPVPVACGLAVGIVSPKRAVVWAPVWACIFTFLLYALLSGSVRSAGDVLAHGRTVVALGGIFLAGLAGMVGQQATSRGHVGKVVIVFVVLCGAMAMTEKLSVSDSSVVFERDVIPMVRLNVERDYIATPDHVTWESTWIASSKCYEISADLYGEKLRVRVCPETNNILGIEYAHSGDGTLIESEDAAKTYLKKFGFRDRFLSGLAKSGDRRGTWSASLDSTRLTLSKTGEIRVSRVSDALPRTTTRKSLSREPGKAARS